jgi:ABC-type multidrug transport system fused ATPase/permease subunit
MKPPVQASDSPTILGYVWAYRRRLLRGMLLACARSLVIAPFPLLFQIIVDRCLPSSDVISVLEIGMIIVGLLLLHYVFAVRGAQLLAGGVAAMTMELRSRIFYKIQFLSFGYLDQQKTGRLLSKYAFDTQKVEQTLNQMLNQLVPTALYSLGTLGILILVDYRLAIVLLCIIPIYGFCRFYFFEKLQFTNNQVRVAQEKLTGTASEYITALRLVRSLGEEKQAEKHLHETSDRVRQSRVEMASMNSMFGTFTFVSTQIFSLIVIAGGVILAIQGEISIGTLFAYITGLPVLLSPVQMFTQFSEQYFVGQESYHSIKELLDSTYVEEWSGRDRPAALRGEIRFVQVSFAYPSSKRPVIRDFNLIIKPGEKIAFVGPSGSGKSTLANLMLGLYRPESGSILIDGIPQENMDMRWFRRQIALVMQESILLSGSVADNIRFARIQATDAEVREAALQANADEFIQKMPKGYQTLVGERGATLSGGQRQRLSIARAILRDPRILILDEPTSALDYESEKLIQEALDRLSRGRTVITIAHRLSTIKNCDRIIVLRQGEIVEEGTFDSLSQSEKGYFRELLEAQGFLDDSDDAGQRPAGAA